MQDVSPFICLFLNSFINDSFPMGPMILLLRPTPKKKKKEKERKFSLYENKVNKVPDFC